jgi:hypothetical protein
MHRHIQFGFEHLDKALAQARRDGALDRTQPN